MPDIDMDFDERRRDEVIRYAAAKYGSDHVAQIITFQTIKGKQGIRDAARVLGFPASVGDRLCKMYPPAIMGRDDADREGAQLSPELRDAYETRARGRSEIVDTARALEGLRREDSVHAAGVVIGDAPLVDVPAAQAREGLARRLAPDRHPVRHARRRGARPAQDGLPRPAEPLGDRGHARAPARAGRRARHRPRRRSTTPTPTRCSCAGDTTGVFQLESAAMRTLIKLLAPDRFEDLMALVALYRPGPLSDGHAHRVRRAQARARNGRRTRIRTWRRSSSDTYGIMVYQEQVMQIAVRDGRLLDGRGRHAAQGHGQEDPRADRAAAREVRRRARSTTGTPERSAQDLFELIEPFADYGFNASHACAYGYVAYQTAYLKAHHPVEYMAAILTSVKDDKDRKPFYLNACRADGHRGAAARRERVRAWTSRRCRAASRTIRYGLSAVRNVGVGRGRSRSSRLGARRARSPSFARLLPEGRPVGRSPSGCWRR